jgi:glycosyltransferase involved in cell wall biosynthesis
MAHVNATKNLVSVIIPAFNAERFIIEAIESALGQTYRPIEIIVVDDGCTDRTAEILRSYEKSVKVEFQNNCGAGAARNRGLSVANGEYIAFLDADDVWFSDKLARQVSLLKKHKKVGLVSGFAEVLDEDGKPLDKKRRWNGDIYNKPISLYEELLLRGNPVWTSAAVVRRSVFDNVGLFDESKRRSQDYDMWIRIAEKTQFFIMKDKVGSYRVVRTSLTHQSSRSEYQGQLEIIKKHSWRFRRKEYIKRLARLHLEWAESEFCYGSLKAGLEAALECIKLRPFNLKIYGLVLGSVIKRPVKGLLRRNEKFYSE